jgi:hypothetical protein
VRRQELPKPYILYVNDSSSEGRRAEKERVLTWGRPVGYVPGKCNYDIKPLSATVMLSLWSQGATDPIVVVVKPHADENIVICWRAKHEESSRKAEGKGSDMLTKCNQMQRLLRQ